MRNPIGRHLTDHELIAVLDREEIGASKDQPLRDVGAAHLDTCWSCRTRLDELHSVVHAFVRLREDVLLSAPEPPPIWPGLAAGMDRVDAGLVTQASRLGRLTQRSKWWARMAAAAVAMIVLWLGGPAIGIAAARAIHNTLTTLASFITPMRGSRTLTLRPLLMEPVVLRPTIARVDLTLASTTPPVVFASNLVDLQLEALWRLHQVGALVAEEVTMTRGAGQLAIDARVADAARKRELQSVLAAIATSGAIVSVRTFEESAGPPPRAQTMRSVVQDLGALVERSAASELLHAHFVRQFGSEADPRVEPAVRQYSARVLMLTRQITLHAFALKRFATDVSASAVEQASAPARVTYQVLVREYAGEVERRAHELAQELDAVFGPSMPEEAQAIGHAALDLVATQASALEDALRAVFAVQAGAVEPPRVDGERLLTRIRQVEQLAADIRQASPY